MLAGVAQTLDKIDGNTGGYDAWQWKVCACKLSFVRMLALKWCADRS